MSRKRSLPPAQPITCPGCGEAVKIDVENILGYLDPSFSHTCGYSGKLAWERTAGTLNAKKRTRTNQS